MSQPRVEHHGDRTTITLTEGKVRDPEDTIAREFGGLTDGLGARHLVLDFREVRRIHSGELGTLIDLHKRVRASGGRLTLTNVRPEVYEVFEVTRLTAFISVHMATMTELRAAYQEAKRRWSGCDWATHYGCLGLNLDGISSERAREAAVRWDEVAGGEVASDNMTAGEEDSLVGVAQHLRVKGAVVYLGEDRGCRLEVRGKSARLFCAEVLAREWVFAAGWLEEIESDAAWAEEEAAQAVRAAERGDWGCASAHVRQACLIESGYRHRRTWVPLRDVIRRGEGEG
jgi:anti-sigma B factor antagonist